MHPELIPATELDIDFLLQLRKLTMGKYLVDIGASTDRDSLLRRIRYEFEHAHIVWVEGQPAGLFKYRFMPQEQHWYLIQIQIHPDFQNRGIGKQLIETLLAQASAQGQPVVLSVLKNNPARHLYHQLGFRVTDQTEREFIMTCLPNAQ
ncbi:GNAT family N-acetyltransferase [Dickeya solani]|uniref:Histone acetyltransferase n=1 Tax=Dickeya solani D s0432-1 TaxID=1231725 RepID=A0AAV3KAG8_9GAMM|nr:GNAT family N-acetyltransferase [Dickeya solani]ANE76318.1 histone acetyltransferase [Dickeya solani IPO 2222]AUC43926.1 Histone acetyltransferase HPA2-related acetyltransferase [Dickeya solani RNS 08.23.3.1.A]AUH08271.1 histone acetyltransferase [Dickeya solani D s0432-1]AUH12277.1 histone acetyltransferase [Dickeya solani]AYQ46801.1 ribosomal-protein-alanine N-acetyltransferase [Dickeya solani]